MVTDTVRIEGSVALLPYFSGLPREAISEASRSVRQRSFATGERALIEGEPCDGLYFVIQGQIRLVKTSAEGRSQVLSVLGPGATFNDIAVFDGGPNPYSATAVGKTLLGFIPRAKMLALLERYPDAARSALKAVSSRQRQLTTMVEDLALRDVTARVAHLLLGCIGRRDHMIEGAATACARITQEEIATMVGSVREVVQRALKQLERDGAIALERTRIRIKDIEALEQWARLS
jgi:CRP-like cAMP-binding protein